jgi:hypothetical protein
MMTLIAGLILLAIPFVLIDLFEDKKRGFIYILFFSIVFQAAVAAATQFFVLFSYEIVMEIITAADIILLAVYFRVCRSRGKKLFSLPQSGKKLFSCIFGIDWVLLVIIAAAFLNLYQVHYDYTGKISTGSNISTAYREVKNFRYAYPYFSDEWDSIAVIQYSTRTASLPIRNPFDPDQGCFVNFEMFFHSFFAQVFLILGLAPLTNYNLLALAVNILILVLVYIFLRLSRVSPLAAGIPSLGITYIVSGSNLPGVWNLLPIHLGVIFSLLGLSFMEIKKPGMVFLASLAVLCFYPPLFVFFSLGMLVFFFPAIVKINFWQELKSFCGHRALNQKIIAAAISLLFVGFIVLMLPYREAFGKHMLPKLFFNSFDAPYLAHYYIYDVVPMIFIFLAVGGSYFAWRNKKWLLAQGVLGLFVWFVYLLTNSRAVIDLERTAFYTSIIVMMISGLALGKLENYLNSTIKTSRGPVFRAIGIGALVFMVMLTPWYSQRENWKKLILVDPNSAAYLIPLPPANLYLTDDDLKIFKNINDKRFLSDTWKGTVIGTATDNFPVVTKNGMIATDTEKFVDDFIAESCSDKKNLWQQKGASYVYLPEFNCPGFEKIDQSSEGLVLYKLSKD